jgi:regulation of enolase protein 1 (concanavalin A-like superfamily)
MPSGWSSADVGPSPSAGTASYTSGSFIAASYGSGAAPSADAFRFIYTRVRGDAKLTARVVALQGRTGRQAGIVLRATLDPRAAETALVTDDAGLVLVRRSASGQSGSKTRVATTTAPLHLRLDRVGSTVAVAYSIDGTTWRAVANVSVSLGAEIYAGLAVAAGPDGGLAAAAFDRLSLISVAANAPPQVSLVSPLTGQVFLAGKPVGITATASDPDDLVARVDFRVNGVKVASDTAAPYTATWTAGAAGVYSVVAAAADFDGAVTTSTPALITVAPNVLPPPDGGSGSPDGGSGSGDSGSGGSGSGGSGGTGPWRLEFGASFDHASLDYYRMDVYLLGGLLPVLSKNIGKPPMDAAGNCRYDVDSLITALPVGQYTVVVRAVARAGSADSIPFPFAR